MFINCSLKGERVTDRELLEELRKKGVIVKDLFCYYNKRYGDNWLNRGILLDICEVGNTKIDKYIKESKRKFSDLDCPLSNYMANLDISFLCNYEHNDYGVERNLSIDFTPYITLRLFLKNPKNKVPWHIYEDFQREIAKSGWSILCPLNFLTAKLLYRRYQLHFSDFILDCGNDIKNIEGVINKFLKLEEVSSIDI